MKETWSEADPLARYVHSNHIVYENLVAFVRGDDPLKDASNERVGALKDAKASDEYVSFWRYRYEVAFTFFSGRPKKPADKALPYRPYSPYSNDDLQAVRCANDDAFTLFNKDPVAEHERQVQLQESANHQFKIDENQVAQYRQLWEAEQARRSQILVSNDDMLDSIKYAVDALNRDNFSKALRIGAGYPLNVIEPSLSLIRITDLGI